MRSGKVREKYAEKVRGSQGIQIELTGGNPVIMTRPKEKLSKKKKEKNRGRRLSNSFLEGLTENPRMCV